MTPEITEFIKTGENRLLANALEAQPALATFRTDEGISLIQFAAYCRNKEAIGLIGAYLEEPDIFEAASMGDIDALRLRLEEKPGLLNQFSADGFTPLGLVSYFGHKNLAEALLQKGADPNIASGNAYKVTPLHSACAVSDYEMARLLIDNGADVNARQMNGVTPLHSAAHNGMTDIVQLLVERGADVNSTMDNGQTPLMLAHEKGFSGITGLLKEAGAKN